MTTNSATFTNKLLPIGKTRVLADRNLVEREKDGYAESEIYFNYNKSTIDNEFQLLMIGSTEIKNPYFGGFFMFSGKFPDQYPFYPPHILAKTQGENTRFHPNFYTNGKCCVSILGTWAGPPWTSCQNLGTVAQTLKSLYIENPITQEPSWEQCKDYRAQIYARIVEYRTLQVAVLKMLDVPPIGFKDFVPIMEQKFMEFYPKYMKKIDNLQKYDGKIEKSSLYQMTVCYNISQLKAQFEVKYYNLCQKYNTLNISNETIINSAFNTDININTTDVNINTISKIEIQPEIQKSKKKYKRKAPYESAKLYTLGFRKKSNNDGNIWEVYKTKSGQYRWKKIPGLSKQNNIINNSIDV